MFICVESDQKYDGISLHPNNTAGCFTCRLPEHYNINTGGQGRWYLALLEIALPPLKTGRKWDPLYVCCTACEPSSIGQLYKPVVASLSIGEVKRQNFVRLPSVHPVPLRVNTLSELTVEIYDKDGRIFKDLASKQPDQSSKCTFLLKWLPHRNLWRP